MKIFATMALLLLPLASFARQQEQQEAEQMKKLYESIDNEVESMTDALDLNDAQVFYVDSIFTHDYKAMYDELRQLNKSKVANMDLYLMVQDKWKEQIYQSLGKVFDEEQWDRYNKSGAAKEKKSRDKRAQKRNQL